jgi:hypothetical protein
MDSILQCGGGKIVNKKYVFSLLPLSVAIIISIIFIFQLRIELSDTKGEMVSALVEDFKHYSKMSEIVRNDLERALQYNEGDSERQDRNVTALAEISVDRLSMIDERSVAPTYIGRYLDLYANKWRFIEMGLQDSLLEDGKPLSNEKIKKILDTCEVLGDQTTYLANTLTAYSWDEIENNSELKATISDFNKTILELSNDFK